MENIRLRAGVACANITPPVGAWLDGYDARKEPSQGVHDDLYAQALVLDDGQTRLALVAADVISLGADFVAALRRRIQATTGMSTENVLVAVSHTHSGPVIQSLFMFPPPEADYVAQLEKKLAGAVAEAAGSLQPVRLGLGQGQVGFAINRRLPVAEGIVMRPNSAGPVDHTVGVLRIETLDGRPLAVVFHYSCHATVLGNLLISADYPGAARHFVEAAYGSNATAIFLQGCCGDVRPHLVGPDGRFRGGDWEDLSRLGRALGAEVVRVCENIHPEASAMLTPIPSVDWNVSGLGVRSCQVRLPFSRHPSQPKLQALLTEAPAPGVRAGDAELDRLWARWLLDRLTAGDVPTHLEVEVQAMRLGPLCLVALPGEVFVEIGQRIERLGSGPVWPVGYANGCVGYLPTAAAYGQGGRNYEVSVAYKVGPYPAPFVPESEDLLVEAASDLLAST